MLGLSLEEAAEATGLSVGFLIGFECSGRCISAEKAALQRGYEARGLAFNRDGSVSWA